VEDTRAGACDDESAWGRRRPSGRALRLGFVLDVASYGARPVPDRDVVQERLRELALTVLGRLGLTLADVDHQWTGDGVNCLLPPDVDPPVVLGVLVRSLAAALAADNARHGDRIRLRAAVGVGLVERTAAGFGGPMIVDISRLVDSAALRGALDGDPAAELAVALSDLAHELIVRPGYPGIPGGQFTRVSATAKEFSGAAWVWLATRQWSEPACLPLGPEDPRQVGGYRVAGRLAPPQPSGSVFLARGDAPGWVALKVFGERLAANPDARRRLASGALAGRVVREPGLAHVVGGPDGDPPWVASTLVRGPSLAATVAETGPLPADTVGWIALDLARTLAALHEAGLAHQAVTPSNVLLGGDGAVLTDFGLNANALAKGPGSAATDVLMLGATVCFAATGYSPWASASPGDLDLTGCPGWLEPVVRACLAADPAQRPAATSVRAQLARTIGPRPTSWLPAPVASRVAECTRSVDSLS
jgi:hypothetical protein